MTRIYVEIVQSIFIQGITTWCRPHAKNTTLTVSNTDVIHTEHPIPIITTSIAWRCEGHWLWCSSDEVSAVGAMFEVELCGLCCLTRVFIPPLVALCSATIVKKYGCLILNTLHTHAIVKLCILPRYWLLVDAWYVHIPKLCGISAWKKTLTSFPLLNLVGSSQIVLLLHAKEESDFL